MTGLFLMAVFLMWLVVCLWLASGAAKFLPKKWGAVVRVLVVVLLLPLPLIDEIVGGTQFSQLCKAHESIQLDRQKVKGATIYFEPVQAISIENIWIPVRLQSWRYVAPETGEVVVSYETLHATGGWLIRALRISEGSAPLTFNANCVPQESIKQLFAALQITALDKPNQIQKVK